MSASPMAQMVTEAVRPAVCGCGCGEVKTRGSRLNVQSPNKPKLLFLQKRVSVFSRGYGIGFVLPRAVLCIPRGNT